MEYRSKRTCRETKQAEARDDATQLHDEPEALDAARPPDNPAEESLAAPLLCQEIQTKQQGRTLCQSTDALAPRSMSKDLFPSYPWTWQPASLRVFTFKWPADLNFDAYLQKGSICLFGPDLLSAAVAYFDKLKWPADPSATPSSITLSELLLDFEAATGVRMAEPGVVPVDVTAHSQTHIGQRNRAFSYLLRWVWRRADDDFEAFASKNTQCNALRPLGLMLQTGFAARPCFVAPEATHNLLLQWSSTLTSAHQRGSSTARLAQDRLPAHLRQGNHQCIDGERAWVPSHSQDGIAPLLETWKKCAAKLPQPRSGDVLCRAQRQNRIDHNASADKSGHLIPPLKDGDKYRCLLCVSTCRAISFSIFVKQPCQGQSEASDSKRILARRQLVLDDQTEALRLAALSQPPAAKPEKPCPKPPAAGRGNAGRTRGRSAPAAPE